MHPVITGGVAVLGTPERSGFHSEALFSVTGGGPVFGPIYVIV